MTIDLWILPNGPASYSIRDRRFVKGRTYRESDPTLVAQIQARADTFGTRTIQAAAPVPRAEAPEAPARAGRTFDLGAFARGGRPPAPAPAPAVQAPVGEAPAADGGGDLPASLEDVREFLVPPAPAVPVEEAPVEEAPAPEDEAIPEAPVPEAPRAPAAPPRADAVRKAQANKGGKATPAGARRVSGKSARRR